MPDVARFFNVDSLTEKYPTWSPYVFSGNRVIDAREIEGLEPHVLFGSRYAKSPDFEQMKTNLRLMGNSKNEEMLNFGGGGYNMYGGYGRVSNVSRAAKVTPEVKFSNTPSPITSAYVNGTQVGVIDYSGSAVRMEINLSKDMQGMGIGSKIFSTAVEGETAFEAQWVQSTKLYGETGASQNLIQYNNAIQKGASPTEAAWSIWSGSQAKTNGFNSVNVQPMQNGIKATFTKE